MAILISAALAGLSMGGKYLINQQKQEQQAYQNMFLQRYARINSPRMNVYRSWMAKQT
jgi:hypothetical protein